MKSNTSPVQKIKNFDTKNEGIIVQINYFLFYNKLKA